MINHLGLIFLSIVITELIILLKIKKLVLDSYCTILKILKLVRFKRVSDIWKERVLKAYSLKLFKFSFITFFFLIVIFIILSILNLVEENFYDFIFSILGIIEITLMVLIYQFFRKK